MSTRNVCPQALPFQNPFGISLSLSLSLFFNFIVLCPIYYYNHFWVFFDLRCTKLFYGQLLNLYVFITINCVLGIFYFVNLSHFVE